MEVKSAKGELKTPSLCFFLLEISKDNQKIVDIITPLEPLENLWKTSKGLQQPS